MNAETMTMPESEFLDIYSQFKKLEERNNPEDGLTLVPSGNLEIFTTRIAKLHRRAEKLNVPKIDYEIVAEGIKPTYHSDDYGRRGEKMIRTTLVPYVLVKITGNKPTLPGYDLVGGITHLPTDEGGRVEIFRAAPDEDIPETFRGRQICDHCNTKRDRNDTYIVRDPKGKLYQVGSTCVGDFLGGLTPKQLSNWLLWYHEMVNFSEDGGSRGLIPHTRYLAFVCATIRNDGWLSKSAANRMNDEKNHSRGYADLGDQAQASAGVAQGWMVARMPNPNDYSRGGFKEAMEEWASYQPLDEDRKLASDAREWAKNIEKPDGSYMTNMKALGAAAGIEWKNLGLSASIIRAYQKADGLIIVETVVRDERGNVVAKKDEKPSEYVGEIDRPIRIIVTVARLIRIRGGDWGDRGMHILKDNDGNRLTWFASASATWLKEGETLLIKGIVKKHELYKGEKQTIVQRVKKQ